MCDIMFSFDEFNVFMLKFMGDGQVWQVNQIKDVVIVFVQFLFQVLVEIIFSGEFKVCYWIVWVCSNFYWVGFLVKFQCGIYQILDIGWQILLMVGDILIEREFEIQFCWQ